MLAVQSERLVQQPHHIGPVLADPLRVVPEDHGRRRVPHLIRNPLQCSESGAQHLACKPTNVCRQVFGPR